MPHCPASDASPVNIGQLIWNEGEGWRRVGPALESPAQLVFVFGEPSCLERPGLLDNLRARHPGAHVMGCSTAGEICAEHVYDHTIVATAIRFEKTALRVAGVSVAAAGGSAAAGRKLAQQLVAPDLAHVFALSDGLEVNGSELVAGLSDALPAGVGVTGGLSADGARFQRTLVLLDGPPQRGLVAALGLYGRHLRVGCGSLGGWDPFGPERLVTRSSGNVLYELDGRSALALYKKYLGEYAKDLPASGLLFPLLVRASASDTGVVRTILAVDEAAQSMTFAGDVPQGALARFMKANFDRLIDGATGAARITHEALGRREPDLAILISCVGRKLVLKQRTEEEVEAVRDVLGPRPVLTGFYSYGEISPFTPSARCDLHNQTMTITTLSES